MEPLWWATRDGDKTCLAMYERHYSSRNYADGRKRRRFVGPGDPFVLRTAAGDAFFVWRRFRDACIDQRTGQPQAGVNCVAFRNEGKARSSELIRQADAIADAIWPDLRHYTYVSQEDVRGGLPGACFLFAGWRYVRIRGHRARTKSGLLILERSRSHGSRDVPALGRHSSLSRRCSEVNEANYPSFSATDEGDAE